MPAQHHREAVSLSDCSSRAVMQEEEVSAECSGIFIHVELVLNSDSGSEHAARRLPGPQSTRTLSLIPNVLQQEGVHSEIPPDVFIPDATQTAGSDSMSLIQAEAEIQSN